MKSNPYQPKNRRQSLRILCADDNTMLTEVMVRLFTQAGHVVEHVGNGLEAWDMMSRDIGLFDLLVTDHQMPGLNGLELVELLRQANYPGRIIVHSSALTSDERESYRGFGVKSIVMKASRADELLNAVAASARG